MNIQFSPATLIDLKNSRKEYFKEIAFPQKLYLERLVVEGVHYKIFDKNKFVDYFIV
jgi:hypothetical protein